MTKWFMSAKKADFNRIAEKFNIDPVIARIMRNRDVITDEEIEAFLNGTMQEIPLSGLMKDLDKAVSIIKRKISENRKIRIIGDYDVDGICATYILYKGLSACGALVDTMIPHRILDGYGINENLIRQAKEDGIDTIVTCDNGIAAKDAFAVGKQLGLTCIVTDHHEIPFVEKDGEKEYIIPQVDALVDPKQPDCTYPNKSICGAVVAFKLVEALMSACNVIEKDKICRELTEPAGLATVCDVMELQGENRILVKTALQYMKNSANAGLRALFKVNEIATEKISAYHLGFIIGPCLNATGRLDTAGIALELLKTEVYEEAIPLATQLKQLNENRKEMTAQGVAQAMELLEQNEDENEKVIVLYLKDVHESLAGIIAGRIREYCNKPVFVLTKAEDGVKGSARSIEGYNIYEEMTKCKELFTKFGGHKMAAGLSLKEENIIPFRNRINELCKLTKEDFIEKIVIDVPMPLSYVSMELIKQLELLEPFGVGNEKPVFAQKNIRFLSGNIIGKNKNMARFTVQDDTGRTYPMVLFKEYDKFAEYVTASFGSGALNKLFSPQSKEEGEAVVMDIIYYPSINEYRGNIQLQYVLQHYKK